MKKQQFMNIKMDRSLCLICGAPSQRTASIGVALVHWQRIQCDTGTEIALCGDHAFSAIPILMLNNSDDYLDLGVQ